MSNKRKLAIEQAKILKILIKISDIDIILSTFVSAFKNKTYLKTKAETKNYIVWLFGNFNLVGTLSCRMSSSKVNLQNLPSTGSKYAKLIKQCFQAPTGWLFTGADFNSLEAQIGALLTRDPNKLKIFTDGYDAHSYNAFGYWPDKMIGISDTVESINSIKQKYPDLRQDSKTITFAAQYGGTYRTFMNSGFSEKEAKKIQANYNILYKVTIEWVKEKLTQACKVGYVALAFGGRLRTPILKQTILGTRSTPYEATAEGRTAGNAMQQSYGMLNNRAANEFMERVYKSEFRLDIKPIAQIHDAQYYLIRNDIRVLEWYNINLIECMQWQELPELKHDKVKLGAEVMIYYPSWANEIKVPNNASTEKLEEILDRCTNNV